MAIKYVNGNELEQEIKRDGITIVNYFANYCGSCQMLTPILEDLSKEVKVLKIDVEQNTKFSNKQGIKGIPATFFYKNGVLKTSYVGFVDINFFKNTIQSL